jgi:uncharacterized membrane protein
MSNDWRKLEGKAAASRKLSRLTLVVGFLAGVLLVIKLVQTPEWALQHDRAVQEQVGWFVIAVIAMGLCSFLFWLNQKWLQSKVRKLRDTRIADLRARLESATEDSKRASIESQLREIGA